MSGSVLFSWSCSCSCIRPDGRDCEAKHPLIQLSEFPGPSLYDVHVNQIAQWRSELIGRATEIFATAAERKEAAGPDVGSLHAKIGQQAMEIDFLAVALGRMDGASAKK